jgi:hypothetical protein
MVLLLLLLLALLLLFLLLLLLLLLLLPLLLLLLLPLLLKVPSTCYTPHPQNKHNAPPLPSINTQHTISQIHKEQQWEESMSGSVIH